MIIMTPTVPLPVTVVQQDTGWFDRPSSRTYRCDLCGNLLDSTTNGLELLRVAMRHDCPTAPVK